MTPSDLPPLAPGYYLDNFEAVLRDVAFRYGDLLRPEETASLHRFLALPLGARRLLVRMHTRKGPWFRPDRFAYPEIDDLPGALAVLEAKGFCAGASAAAPAELVALLRRAELQDWLARFGLPCPKGLSRDALAARLLAGVDGARLGPALAAGLRAVAPLGREWVRLIFFLFFGDAERDLSDFVLADLGRVQYEAYPLDPGGRLFQARADVDFLLELGDLREAFGTAAATGDRAAMERLTSLLLAREEHPGVRQQRRFHRLLNAAGREWERLGDPERALACYRRSERPPARERRVRLLAQAPETLAAAAELALEVAAAPLEAGEERFARRVMRSLGRHPELPLPWLLRLERWRAEHPDPPPPLEFRLTVARHPSGSVELAALEAARQDGWDGRFTENSLWSGLFGLAFWEVLFLPVPGAFQHRLQAGPSDLGSPSFHARRAEAFAARFQELEAPGALAREVQRTAARKRGIANLFVNWRELDPEFLETALEVVPRDTLLSVLRAMAPSPLAFRSGFPDLLLYRRREGRCLLWEVKGPGDALRPEQERWLAHFNREGVEARVAWVQYR